MSRSRSRSRSPIRGDDVSMERKRSASEDRVRERPDEEEAPVKYVPPCLLRIWDQLTSRRARVDTTREDKARGKRMFGNILGTLQRFKKDDKNLRTSDAVGLPHRCRYLRKLTTRPGKENSYRRESPRSLGARRIYIPRYWRRKRN